MPAADDIRTEFMQGLGRIAQFWGFPRAMGAAYAAVYLSPAEISLEELTEAVGITKGGLSPHMAMLERLGLVRRINRPSDRRDFYTAETDFWGVIRRILREREQREFDLALRTVSDCLDKAQPARRGSADEALMAFYRERLGIMQRFFKGLDRAVAAILAIEDFKEAAFERFFRPASPKGTSRRKEKP